MTSNNENITARRPTLIVVTGATASGKTALALQLASHLGCDIISADSRQIYRGMPIGTAAPTADELARVRHHFIAALDPADYYSAAMYEADVMALLPRLWQQSPYAVLCGGSMMYVDAVTDGIDELPTITPATRERVNTLLAEHGPDGLLAYLEMLDPVYASQVDPANLRRVAHAVEISLQAGCPYSDLRRSNRARRPFDIIKVAIEMERSELFDRINRRVDVMMEAGLLDEARTLYPRRRLNALNTVGYKELFAYFDGEMDLTTAIARIGKNTRVYAKKQLTWLARPGVRPTTFVPAATAFRSVLSLLSR